MSAAGVSVFIVDAHAIFRRGMATCLQGLPEVGAVAGASSVVEARRHPALAAARVVIADTELTGGHGFIAEVGHALGIPVVACSPAADAREGLSAIEAGASAVVAKDTLTPEALAGTLRAVLRGARMLPAGVLELLLARGANGRDPAFDGAGAAQAELTSREQQVLRLIADGHLTREVAEELSYSERTVKNVLHDVVTKLGARSRSHAVANAMRSGLI